MKTLQEFAEIRDHLSPTEDRLLEDLSATHQVRVARPNDDEWYVELHAAGEDLPVGCYGRSVLDAALKLTRHLARQPI